MILVKNKLFIIYRSYSDSDWIYSVIIKTQAVLPAQTNLRGKLFLSIYGDKASLNDAVFGSTRSIHAGGENTIELKSTKRLGEVQIKKTN